MKTKLAILLAVCSAAVFAATAPLASARPEALAKSCSAGYVHAYLTWGEKCLRAGEFCKVANAEYRQYGYVCPASGHLTYATKATTTSAASTTPVVPLPTTTTTQSSSTTTTTTPVPTPAPAAPAAAMALCKDGTLSYSATHSGTCSSHGGVATWYR